MKNQYSIFKSKIIKNPWQPLAIPAGQNISAAPVLDEHNTVEGLYINRYQGYGKGFLKLQPDQGHIITVLKGSARLQVKSQNKPLNIQSGTHLYIPPYENALFETSSDFYAIHVSGREGFANGTQFIIRQEKYARTVRDTLTPQYLSRRIFTNRDETLSSKHGTQIAWFHTTMFDSMSLPENAEGEEVFKMSYNNQTEPNIIYDLSGQCSVRFARHPYLNNQQKQSWSEWFSLDNETTYYLNETADGPEVEHHLDPITQEPYTLRNRHEVLIESDQAARPGYVSLCCLFDPGPTGLERHEPGEYSSYAPVDDVLGTADYESYLEKMAPLDSMIDLLSLLEAQGHSKQELHSRNEWAIFQSQLKNKRSQQQSLIDRLKDEGNDREKIVAAWRL